MRWIWILCSFMVVMWTGACSPDMINHNDDGTTKTEKTPHDAGPTDTLKKDKDPISCKEDCDCVPQGLLCDNGTCRALRRLSQCPDCSGKCVAGQPCQKDANTVGVCPAGPAPCKHDCDCIKPGGVCDGSTCQPLKRASRCVSCDGGCTSGEPCINKDQSIGTCSDRSCKIDCDCVPHGQLCDSGTCRFMQRVSQCPDCNGKCVAGEACQSGSNTVGVCPGGPIACKDDCDCAAKGQVCEANKCSDVERASTCVACAGKCLTGQRCLNPDKTIGVCNTLSCKIDCDCVPHGLLCDSGTCRALRRLSQCPDCNGKCIAGEACQSGPKTVGVCPGGPIACKHDCDCVNIGMVCQDSKCQQLRRQSLCLACSNTSCTLDDPCLNPDKSIGVCGGAKCKHDCDCLKPGGLCHNGRCNIMIKRVSLCVSCSGACTPGDPCQQADGTAGTCAVACKHDCDCIKTGGVCHNNKCDLTIKRANFCISCNGKCTAGDPCLKPDNSIGVCPGANTFTCGPISCTVGKEYCDKANGGAAPSCGMPGYTQCPVGCVDRGLNCADGKVRCDCSWSCKAIPQSCTTCSCLETALSLPKQVCSCTASSTGGLSVVCNYP